MLFHSNDFLVFLGGVLLASYIVRFNLTLRNGLLLVASYIFYSWWDYRFSLLLLFSSLMDFGVGLAIARSDRPIVRKVWLVASLIVNFALLGVFKYLDFFRESTQALLASAGWDPGWEPWHLILPVGISFYTFQSMSYVIDVYRGEIAATKDPIQFLGYVAFFPQLVAGPIERATHLLPQFGRVLQIDARKVEAGVWLILWGLFKKVALADNFAPLVELVYDSPAPAGPMVVLGTAAFALQVYCDFSAYSDIARGVAGFLGFDLMINFNLPYFATSLREFWRRWHISLSTWIRDYLYTPLGGNRRGPHRTYFNLMLTMLLAGLWHGAGAQFVLWGLWHGVGLSLNRWWTDRQPRARRGPCRIGWILTMGFVLYGWLLFRAQSIGQVQELTAALADWTWPPWGESYLKNLVVLLIPLGVIEVCQFRTNDPLAPLRLPWWGKALLQGGLLLAIALFWEREASPFIYFQF